MVVKEVSKKGKVNKRVEKTNRTFWCSIGEHWNKANWKRIKNLWKIIRNEDKQEELLQHLWEEVMEKGIKAEPREEGFAHKLEDWEIRPIIGTLEFFCVNNYFLKQTQFDLYFCKYRIFDWIATCLDGRMWNYPEEDELERIRVCWVICKYAEIYLNFKGDIHKFAEYLARGDLQPEFEGREEEITSSSL